MNIRMARAVIGPDGFYKILMEKYKSYGATKENNIKQIKKDIGSRNLRKIIYLALESLDDIEDHFDNSFELESQLIGTSKEAQLINSAVPQL